MENLTPARVFVAGGMPQETYVSREHLGFERTVLKWGDGAHTTLLSVSGPTKTGKTVLLKRFFDDAIWLSGGTIESMDDFWESICDELEVFTDLDLSVAAEDSSASGLGASVSLGIIDGSHSRDESKATSKSVVRGRTRSAKSAARKALKNEKPTLIIDDFHYVGVDNQARIIRGLKDLIFDGLPVIVLAVPHRAYDAIRVEKEMTGRVDSLPLGVWAEDDLQLIATQGFNALKISVSADDTRRLARESFGSPNLMQTHCLAFAESITEGTSINATDEWNAFFRQRAQAASKAAFDLLKQGPRQRSDRNMRKLKDGLETDIYGAILAAIAETGPRTSLQYEEVRGALRNVLDSTLPQRHEITNILEQMTKIARDKIEGEPVLEYDAEYSTLYIADPFFAYYLRWAPESLKELRVHPK